MGELRTVTFKLEEEWLERLMVICERYGINRSEFIRRAVKEKIVACEREGENPISVKRIRVWL